MNGNTTLIVYLGIFFGVMIGQQVVARFQHVRRAKSVKHLPMELILRSLASIILLPAGYLQPKYVPLAFVVTGICIMLLGVTLALWAQSVMGRLWIPGIGTHTGHKLVTSGPFGYIRHPIYTGIGLVAIGGAVCSMNPFTLGFGGLFWLSIVIRVPHEEMLMHQKFKKRWERYVESTGFFVPRFRR